jgi:adenylate kinase
MVHVIMLGPPGAGKGTQAERLAQEHRIPRVSTGDILREAIVAGTPLGIQAKAVMDAGRLVGDDIVIGIVRERLKKPDAAAGWVLDGFPRTVPQAEALDQMMEGHGSVTVIELVVPFEELVRRLSSRRICSTCGTNGTPGVAPGTPCSKCGGELIQRADDREDVVRERLRVFQKQTEPLIEYYRGRSALHTVEGSQAPDRVAADVLATVSRSSRLRQRSAAGVMDQRP